MEHSRFTALLKKRGISIEYKEPLAEQDNNATYDDFKIETERVNTKYERITTDYTAVEWEDGKTLFQIDTINSHPISLSIQDIDANFLDEVRNNQSQVICYIDPNTQSKRPLRNGTLVRLKEFPSIQFIIARIKQRNTFDNIYRYSISRT